MKKKYVIKKALMPKQMGKPGQAQPVGGGKAGLQLTTAKTNPNVRRWQQTQPKEGQPQGQPQGPQGQPQRKPYWGEPSGAEVGHRVNYHGNPITITGVGEHGVTARDEHGRKYEIFHHELRSRKKGI
jgi:hypothetical protein